MRATLICAWCGASMGFTETPTGRPARGICGDCLLKFFGITQAQLRHIMHPTIIHAPSHDYYQPPLPRCGSKWT